MSFSLKLVTIGAMMLTLSAEACLRPEATCPIGSAARATRPARVASLGGQQLLDTQPVSALPRADGETAGRAAAAAAARAEADTWATAMAGAQAAAQTQARTRAAALEAQGAARVQAALRCK